MNYILYLIFLSLIGIKAAYSQDIVPNRTLQKSYSGVGIHGGIGFSNFSFHSTTTYKNHVLLFPSGIQGRFFLKERWALLSSIDYLSLGASEKGLDIENSYRLRSLQLSSSAEYFFSRNTAKPIISLQGGLFVGKILEPILFYHTVQSNSTGQSRPIDTFIDWNVGATLGIAISKNIYKSHSISVSYRYDVGLLNIATKTTDPGTRYLTRANHLSLSYSFH
ncbi:porin family protein [Spirosoma arboris]|nr:outer membrane beta-barrel protein [Spirosoma arboris]